MTSGAKQGPKPEVPKFASIEEEAEFWDTHSPEEFPGEFEEIESPFAGTVELVRTDDWRKRLARELAVLPDDERQVLTLTILGLRPEDAATALGWTPARCRKALRGAQARLGA